MANDKKMSDLKPITVANGGAETIVYESGITKRITFASIADSLWEQMYVRAKSVICICSWCGAGNAITNAVCCQCGGAIGEDAKK